MRLCSSLRFKFGRVGTLSGGKLNLVSSLLIELSFKVVRVGTLGGRVGDPWGLNLNLVSSLKLNLSFRVGRVGTLGGGLGWGP